MSTYSSLKFELILTGDQSGQWGNTTNANIGTAINEAIAGSVDITFASADLTLTLLDTNAAQSARNLRLNLTGTAGGAARTLTLGSGCQISKPYIVNNTLANAVTVKNTTGTGIAVPAGATMWLFNNGTNVVDAVSYLSSLTLGSALVATSGGTGQSSYAVGDLLYANTTTSLAKLADIATGNALISGGVTTAPSWGKIGLTTHVDGTLAATNGGTGTATVTTGDILYGGTTSNTWAKLAAGTAGQLLQTNGAAAPTWVNAPTFTGVSSFSAGSTGFTPTTATTGAVSLAGTLGAGYGGTGQSTYTIGDILYASAATTLSKLSAGTAGYLLQANGAAAPSWVAAPTFTGVSSFSAGSTGFTPTTATTGAVSLAGTLGAGYGGTGQSTYSVGEILYASAATTLTKLAAGTAGYLLQANGAAAPSWVAAPTFTGVSSFTGGTTGLLPNTASTGAISLSGTLAVANGGTGVTTSTGTGNVVLSSNPSFGTDISVNGLTVGKGNGAAGTNTAVGYEALKNNGAASDNTAIGYQALKGVTTSGNTAVGYQAGVTGGTTTDSVFVGAYAGQNTTGYAANGLTFVGAGAGGQNIGAGRNTAVGYLASGQNQTGFYNTSIGNEAGYYVINGSYNTSIGNQSGGSITAYTGTNLTNLGHNAQPSSAAVNNQVTLGDYFVTSLRCNVTAITALSDARDKYDIEDLPIGLDFINSLRPRRFKWDRRDHYFDKVKADDGRETQVAVPKDGSRKSDEWSEGFVAQEADEAAMAANADWLKLVSKDNLEKLEMSPGKLIPVLVKAIQELTARLEALEAKN